MSKRKADMRDTHSATPSLAPNKAQKILARKILAQNLSRFIGSQRRNYLCSMGHRSRISVRMFRKTTWRNTVSDAVSSHQDQALNTTIFLLKSFGPTGFLLKEDGEARNFKVFLGNPHTCTCPVFTREQEPCKHICWVLLRKFRVPREHEYSFQHGLVERQILEVLHGLHQTKDQRTEKDPSAVSGTLSQPLSGQEAGSVCRKAIQAQDVCPICQEELLEKKLPVCHCRFGCGNNVHISCMKVWADHQGLSDREETVKCPLCREDFSSLKLLQEQTKNAGKLFTAAEREKADRHLGVVCHSCWVCPVTGRCFKCTVCSYFYLCEDCLEKGVHPQHPFASRTKRREKWHFMDEDLNDIEEGAISQPTSINPELADSLPEDLLGCLPAIRVRSGSRLLDVGQQCRICLLDFFLGQRVRPLPCHHKFHARCVDGILQRSNSCPFDGYVIYNPLTWRTSERKTSPKPASCRDYANRPSNNLQDLFIPGVALRDRNTKISPSHGSLKLEVLPGSSAITDRFQGLCIATDGAMKEGKRKPPLKQTVLLPESTSITKKSTKHSPASPAALTKVKRQPQLNLFVGLQRLESDHVAILPSSVRRTRPQPIRTATKGPNNGQISELRLTLILINTQEQRKMDT